MEPRIMEEVKQVVEDLRTSIERRRAEDNNNNDYGGNSSSFELESVDRFFDMPDLNIIWGLVAAKR